MNFTIEDIENKEFYKLSLLFGDLKSCCRRSFPLFTYTFNKKKFHNLYKYNQAYLRSVEFLTADPNSAYINCLTLVFEKIKEDFENLLKTENIDLVMLEKTNTFFFKLYLDFQRIEEILKTNDMNYIVKNLNKEEINIKSLFKNFKHMNFKKFFAFGDIRFEMPRLGSMSLS
jgi:hypothetical protein